MKITLSHLYLMGILVLTLSACGKDKVSPDRETLLKAHTWKYSQISRKSEDDWFLDMQDMNPIIYHNYEIAFAEDGTYTLNTNSSGTWKLSEDKKTILFDYDDTYRKWARNIEELTEKSLIISWDADYVGQENQVHRATILLQLKPVE